MLIWTQNEVGCGQKEKKESEILTLLKQKSSGGIAIRFTCKTFLLNTDSTSVYLCFVSSPENKRLLAAEKMAHISSSCLIALGCLYSSPECTQFWYEVNFILRAPHKSKVLHSLLSTSEYINQKCSCMCLWCIIRFQHQLSLLWFMPWYFSLSRLALNLMHTRSWSVPAQHF